MSERAQRQNVVRWLRSLDAHSVENRVGAGTPDVNYVEGWIELKWRQRWPARADTVVEVAHFNQEQRIWLERRWKAGGAAWLLLQVGQQWLLFAGDVAAAIVGRAKRADLEDAAVKTWQNCAAIEGELAECLQRRI